MRGLCHLRARQDDPATGRFAALDPLGPAIGDPYVSACAYVNNNPVPLPSDNLRGFALDSAVGPACAVATTRTIDPPASLAR